MSWDQNVLWFVAASNQAELDLIGLTWCAFFSVLSAQAGGETDSVVESLTDTDSVKGLGETTDFLNMVRNETITSSRNVKWTF